MKSVRRFWRCAMQAPTFSLYKGNLRHANGAGLQCIATAWATEVHRASFSQGGRASWPNAHELRCRGALTAEKMLTTCGRHARDCCPRSASAFATASEQQRLCTLAFATASGRCPRFRELLLSNRPARQTPASGGQESPCGQRSSRQGEDSRLHMPDWHSELWS